MCTPELLVSQIEEVSKALSHLSTEAAKYEPSRKRLLAVLRDAISLVEAPIEVIWRMIMEPHQIATLRTAMAMNLLEPIVSSKEPMTATELTAITKCDKQLIVRIMRPLTSMKIFSEVGFETYASTPVSQVLAARSVGGGFKFMFDEGAVSVVHMPTFLANTGFKNPEGPMGNFQSAFKTELQLFPWLMQHSEQMRNFNDLMVGQRMTRIEWFDVGDARGILGEAAADGVLLVDIGGNRGNDLEAFKTKYPGMSGRLVNQDLPPVIADITDLHEEIVRMPHDFFTPQPVIGAKAYYLRYILHDHSDEKCREILGHVVKAMKPGYSKVLIFDYVLPDTGSALFPALLDINMLALLSGMERTETTWKALLETVGLKIVKFWTAGKETEGLIEAELI